MSPFFVKYFKSNNPCPCCSVRSGTEKVAGKSLCGPHLAVARMVWRLWGAARRRLGRCIECARKSVAQNCRCATHRKANKAKCTAWYHKHRAQRAKYTADNREGWIAQGRCPTCPQHTALAPGRRRCANCNGDCLDIVDVRQQRQAFKAARSEAKAAEAIAALVAMGYIVTAKRDGTPSLRRIEA